MWSRAWLCVLWIAAAISPTLAAPAPPKISAESAIVVDAVSGKVLYEKHCRQRRPPASTTKIMTAILALENGHMCDKVCASQNASKTQFSSLHLKPGEQLPMRDLLYGLLLRSGNDAAVCIAENVAGSESKFVERMNKKAREIGAKDTHFVNPHGLHDPKHYSTAYDLALIARYAIRNPLFNEIVSTKTTKIERSINTKDVYIRNTARFLWRFDGADGIKTGYTKQAGRCFVGSATRDGWRVISVVLKSQDAGRDTIDLMNYVFKFYRQVCFAKPDQVMKRVRVAGGVEEELDLTAASGLALVVRKGTPTDVMTEFDIPKVSAPVVKGEKLGTLTGYVNGKKVGSVDLVASKSVDRTLAATAWVWTRNFLGVCLFALMGYVGYGTAVAKAARRRRRRLATRS